MQTKNLSTYKFNLNWCTKIIRNINLIKKLVLFLLIIISFVVILRFKDSLTYANNNSIFVADFKTDINMLTETAIILEFERNSDKNLEIGQYGSNGEVINENEITPDLKKALIKIIDTNNDEKISNEEILEAGIMNLEPETFKKELKKFQFNLISADRNLNKYIIITKGDYAGTVLYNGNMKYIDDENKQYFGLELFN